MSKSAPGGYPFRLISHILAKLKFLVLKAQSTPDANEDLNRQAWTLVKSIHTLNIVEVKCRGLPEKNVAFIMTKRTYIF